MNFTLIGQQKGGIIHVWDTDITPTAIDGITILWSGFLEEGNKNIISMPQFVEENSISLRSRYLAWIHELGLILVNGKSVVDHFELRPGFSYWWMTLLSEKSIFKSPQIFDVIKLIALEELQKKIRPVKVVLTSGNKQLVAVFTKWCDTIKIQGEVHLLDKIKEKPSFKHIYRSLPEPLQALVGLLRHTMQRFPFRRKYNTETNNADITFVDYFMNLIPDGSGSGLFSSGYWTELVNVLRSENVSTNWLHIFVSNGELKTPAAASELMNSFTKSSANKESHLMLDGIINFRMVFIILRDFCKILRSASRLRKIKEHFSPSHSALNFWDLYEEEWKQGTRGKVAMASLIHFNLFENIFSNIHQQKLGFFLLENQNWEIAMTYAWKKNGHGRLIGISHSTVRFWDLRYFHDQRTYHQLGKNPLPMPDYVALNGPVAMNEYLKGKYPSSKLLEAEALRYFYLDELNKKEGIHKSSTGIKILVCSDIDAGASRKMIKWLEEIFMQLPIGTTISVKAHPAQPIKAEDYPSLPMTVIREPIRTILKEYDVVYASYITSAAVDAYCSGLPVIQVVDGAAFNMSALRGLESITFVTSQVALAAALKSITKKQSINPLSFFYLHKDLPRWRRILAPAILNQ